MGILDLDNKRLKWIIVFVTIIGTFLAMLDGSTINIALYDISQKLNEPITSVQWVVVGYMLILTAFLPFFGKLSEVCHRNQLYSAGFIVFALGSFLSFLSPTLPLLIASRCVEAIGASILVSNSTSIIASLFRGAKRGKALGINGAIAALGSMSGPALAGVLINYFGWNYVFLPETIIALIFGVISYRTLPSYCPPHKKQKFDYKGFIYFCAFLFSLLTVISQGHIWGWTSKRITALTITFVIATIMFILRELKVSYALIDFSLFKIRSFTLGNIAINLSYWGVTGIGVIFPLFAQQTLGFSPMTTGFIVLSYALSLIFTAPICGNLAGKYGSKWFATSGGLVLTTALILFSRLDNNSSISLLVAIQMLLGIGNGLFQSPSNTGVLSDVNNKQLGIAGGILALARNTGMIMGTAVAINIMEFSQNLYTSQKASTPFLMAYQHTALMLAFFVALCTLSAFNAYKGKKA